MLFCLITGILLLFSFLVDPNKSRKAVRIAYQRLLTIFPSLLAMLILVSLVLYFFPQDRIIFYLGNGRKIVNIIIAALVGSIAAVPGFIAFPLAGILRDNGISYTIIAVFTTTLMMVGVTTFPVEVAYLGKKVALIRNIIGLVIALIVALLIGLYFGEVTL